MRTLSQYNQYLKGSTQPLPLQYSGCHTAEFGLQFVGNICCRNGGDLLIIHQTVLWAGPFISSGFCFIYFFTTAHSPKLWSFADCCNAVFRGYVVGNLDIGNGLDDVSVSYALFQVLHRNACICSSVKHIQ